MADFANGVFVGVTTFVAPSPFVSYDIADAQVTANGSAQLFAPVAYDTADAIQTFTLPNGTVGALSYNIPWGQVDSTQANQALVPTTFNLNFAGQNFTYGSSGVNYSAAPTLLFANGIFQGVNFALDTTTAPGFAYTSVAMNGLNATITQVGGQQFFAAGPVKLTMLSFDFSNAGTASYTYDLTIKVAYSGAPTKEVTFTVNKGTTAGGLRDMAQTALKSVGVDATAVDGNRLKIEGTVANNLTQVFFAYTPDPTNMNKPNILGIFEAGMLKTADITPEWSVVKK
jgi:hypothetical protein